MVAERVAHTPEFPAVLAHDGVHHDRARRDRAGDHRLGIVGQEQQSCGRTTNGLRTEVLVLGRLVGDPERRVADRKLRNQRLAVRTAADLVVDTSAERPLVERDRGATPADRQLRDHLHGLHHARSMYDGLGSAEPIPFASVTFDPTDVRGTPFGAPLVPPLPITMRQVEILTVVYETDREAADALVPAPLTLGSDLVALHVYWMHDAEWFGVYGESAVHLSVRLPDGTPGTYSPFLVLGSDGAVAAGREHYGQPKKHGEVALAARGDLLVGVVSRNGIEIATATMCFKQERAAPDALEHLLPGSALNINLRVLPDEDGRFRRELVARRFTDVVAHEAWQGPATLELRPNAQAPLHLLPVRQVRLGLHRIVDLTLPPGTIVHRYVD